MDSRRIAGVILAGGKATRMGGGDKGLLRIGGRTSLERIIDVLRPRCAQLIVVPRRGVRYAYAGLETVADIYPDCGPLGGLHAGLVTARLSHAFVAACDMPGLAPDVVDFLVERIADQDAIVPCWDGDIEPLHAIYARRIVPQLEEVLRRGGESVREVLPQLRVQYVSEAELADLHGAHRSFANVNTPAELRSAAELIQP